MSTRRPCLECQAGVPCFLHRAEELRRERVRQEREAIKRAQKTVCPSCGCRGKECTVVLPDDGGEGLCAPAGDMGLKECSACTYARQGGTVRRAVVVPATDPLAAVHASLDALIAQHQGGAR